MNQARPSLDAESLLEQFEHAWQQAPPADLSRFVDLATSLADDAPDVITELIYIDAEYRYRSRRGTVADRLGAVPRIEDYERYLRKQGLPTPNVTPAWVAEEYRLRTIWGDQPSHTHYADRFASLGPELGNWLRRVDEQLRREVIEGERSPPALDPRAPLTFEDFQILKLVGRGAIGKVFRARQHSLNRLVALKALHKSHQQEPWAIDLFLREAQILAQLQHPAIVQIYGLGRFPAGGYFQVLEFIDGTDLRARISGELSMVQGLEILAKVVDAVAFAHRNGVVHCDLKPENILIERQGRVVVSDFGMAHLLHREFDGGLGGTPRYMAPEMGQPQIGPKVDVFAIGQILAEIQQGRPLPPLQELSDECRRADPQHRPSAEEIAARLKALGQAASDFDAERDRDRHDRDPA